MAERLVYPAVFDPTVELNRIQITVPMCQRSKSSVSTKMTP